MPSDDVLLTVAIPTFNRPDKLRHCIELFRDQTDCRFNLMILDNSSPVPAAEVLADLLPCLPAASVRIVRHAMNVGGDVNILRCFELCETEYIWVIGDDDEPLPNAIATVLENIQNNPGSLFYNYQCELYQRSRESISHDLDGFIQSIDSYSNILFISTSIFRRCAVIQFIPWAYHYMYSMAPHLVLLIRTLESAPSKCMLLKDKIVKWTPPSEGFAWSGVRQMLGLGILLDLPLSAGSRHRLARLLSSPRALEYVTVQLLAYLMNNGDRARACHAMDQIHARLLTHSGRRTLGFRFVFYRHILFRTPSLGVAVFRILMRLSGRGETAFDFRDPFR